MVHIKSAYDRRRVTLFENFRSRDLHAAADISQTHNDFSRIKLRLAPIFDANSTKILG